LWNRGKISGLNDWVQAGPVLVTSRASTPEKATMPTLADVYYRDATVALIVYSIGGRDT
jgi:hypothetical protein